MASSGISSSETGALSSRELRARRLRHAQERRSSSKDDEEMRNAAAVRSTSRASASDLAEQSAARREQLVQRARQATDASRLTPSTTPIPTPTSSPSSKTKAPRDEVRKTEDDAVRGWSTLSSRRASKTTVPSATDSATARGHSAANESAVDQYLSQRTTVPRAPMVKQSSTVSSDSSAVMGNISRSQSFETTDSSSEESIDSAFDENGYEDDSSDDDSNEKEWSVRVCIVSAVDLPASVVPNLPFSPVLRVGLVRLPDELPQVVNGTTSSKKATEERKLRAVSSAMAQGGLQSIPKARVRVTDAKILSKRDNGSCEFHEEMRWDRVKHPDQIAVAVELSSKAVMTPKNIKESPPAQKGELPRIAGMSAGAIGRSHLHKAATTGSSVPGGDAGPEGAGMAGFGSLFRRPSSRKTGTAEMETANAAAAVAKLLVEGNNSKQAAADGDVTAGPLVDSRAATLKTLTGNQSEVDVKLRPRRRRKEAKMTEDLPIGSQVVPLTKLPLRRALEGKESARIEQWFELESPNEASRAGSSKESSPTHAGGKRNPSLLLEITFSSPEVLDDSEDEMEEDDGVDNKLKASFSKRASIKIRSQLKDEVEEKEEPVEEEPELLPGVIDYVCVVGARDIGDQKADDGSSGWVNTTPECCILEQFPPDDDFHKKNGRSSALPNKVEWFCFPEGVRLWRGITPPNLDELNLTRFSASSPANIGKSIASFDACLGCTTSFSWFVIASNSDEYGSESVKTYGAVIRFFVPAPAGIDPTQDDFAQTFLDVQENKVGDMPEGKRLWVPVGICLTSSIPIIGTMEAILLRLCEALCAKGISSSQSLLNPSKVVHEELASLIISFQRPIPGVVNCSIPFLRGERFDLSLPPRGGLPPLPHGSAVSSVCRLLGAEGINFLLAAFLTECKILLHSDDIANLSLVAEVMTALIYPFTWSLPYIPVLPMEMLEFLEAPLSFLLGIHSSHMKFIDPFLLEDVVVVDLNSDFSLVDQFEGRHAGGKSKTPMHLPASVANNISTAVYRLLRAEEKAEEECFGANMAAFRPFPRLEPESLPEKEFRIAVAMEICGLVRGYQDCLVYASSSQPVFNMDRFLQIAPALFEEQRGVSDGSTTGSEEYTSQYVLSPRSRRFMSLLVNTQHFHQLLDHLESEHVAFFQEIMTTVNTNNVTRQATKRSGHVLSLDFHKNMESLCAYLKQLDGKVPTYRVERVFKNADAECSSDVWDTEEKTQGARFPRDMLQQITLSSMSESKGTSDANEPDEGVKHISLEYLVELEKNPWHYQRLFEVSVDDSPENTLKPLVSSVKLRDAIGERRYRAWKLAIEQEKFDADETSVLSDDTNGKSSVALDFDSMLTSATAESSVSSDASASGTVDTHLDSVSSAQKRVADAKDREVLRRCLEKALSGSKPEGDVPSGKSRDLISESETALRNPSARKFLLSVLSKRAAQQDEPEQGDKRRSSSGAKLDNHAFETLLRLGCAMLDACMEAGDYDSAYSMLKLTAGLFTITGESDSDVAVSYMTGRMGLHPIYADLGVWERAKDLHLSARKDDKEVDFESRDKETLDEEDDEYEATVATLYEMLGYGIPAEELARFASRVSEKKGWFQSERGPALMLLARRLTVRREHGGSIGSRRKSDIELMNPSSPNRKKEHDGSILDAAGGGDRSRRRSLVAPASQSEAEEMEWVETAWCHPAAQSARRLSSADKTRRTGTQNLLNMLDEQKVLPNAGRQNSRHMKRSAVTSVAYLGSSVVVTGGLDGGIFIARRVAEQPSAEMLPPDIDPRGVHGVHLDWGSSGSRYAVGSTSTSLDGEYGVGAVACLASTRGSHSSYSALSGTNTRNTKDTRELLSEEDLVEAMEGCRVVAGTTCGDLRVWSVKDVFSAVFYSTGDTTPTGHSAHRTTYRAGTGVSSKFANGAGRRRPATDFAAGSSLTRLKFSLRGRALSGHRGGVSCIDVPSSVYRPDTIISGGADGLIKLWSLRSPGAGRRTDIDPSQMHSPSTDPISPRAKAAQNGDALSILSGHGGRVLCVKTAWHGDRLLSGGADRTVRVWDVAGGGGRCLNSLSGHLGWVTHVRYWGPNTIVSASTDRSVALWDARVRNSPLFSLRHHYCPVSDLLVGARTDPIMLSAASDGTVAAWDFRRLSGASDSAGSQVVSSSGDDSKRKTRHCQIVRNPPGRLYLHDYSRRRHVSGSILLARGPGTNCGGQKTAMCVGSDAIIREWDYRTGNVVSEHVTGHCDLISHFHAIQGDTFYDTQLESAESKIDGTITTSWDGTVRMRSLVRKKE